MYMRTFNALALTFLLTACGGSDTSKKDKAMLPGATSLAEAEAIAERANVEGGKISCQVNGATQFSRACRVEQKQTPAGIMLTIWHPDGGFRKLKIQKGPGVVAADGADKAEITPLNPREIEVYLAGNRYRLPATVSPKALVAKPAAKG
jgi:hypothetical protein